MNLKDPLEHAFGLLKAGSTELAHNPVLENKLMNQLQNQLRPRPWKKAGLIMAALLGLILAGGGIAAAAGYNPLRLFNITFTDEQGNSLPYTVTGQTVNPDGSITLTVQGEGGQQGTVRVEASAQDNK